MEQNVNLRQLKIRWKRFRPRHDAKSLLHSDLVEETIGRGSVGNRVGDDVPWGRATGNGVAEDNSGKGLAQVRRGQDTIGSLVVAACQPCDEMLTGGVGDGRESQVRIRISRACPCDCFRPVGDTIASRRWIVQIGWRGRIECRSSYLLHVA